MRKPGEDYEIYVLKPSSKVSDFEQRRSEKLLTTVKRLCANVCNAHASPSVVISTVFMGAENKMHKFQWDDELNEAVITEINCGGPVDWCIVFQKMKLMVVVEHYFYLVPRAMEEDKEGTIKLSL